jgi:DNA primase
LMESVLALMPDEERVQYSAMTGQSLFYMGSVDLRHKVLAIVEEEGAERASYALKLLQSEGELTIASTGKDAATGRLMTHTYRVEGPVMIFLTTTAIEVDEELLNRCLVLAVDEAREQTRAIHARQRRAQSLEGRSLSAGRSAIRRLHQNAQRLLRPLVVVNPFAEELVFPDHATRMRRDHMKYLTLINAVTLLHQHQRPLKSAEVRGGRLEYIEVTREDVEVATKLARAVLLRGLDELPPQTRRMLEAVQAMVKEKAQALGVSTREARFTRREVRERTHLSKEQVRVHMTRLLELEYVFPHRGQRGHWVDYELAYTEEQEATFELGLLRTMDHRPGQTGHRPGQTGHRPGIDRGGARSMEVIETMHKSNQNGSSTGSSARAHLERLASST